MFCSEIRLAGMGSSSRLEEYEVDSYRYQI